MKWTRPRMRTRAFMLGVGALFALGMLTACGGGASTAPTAEPTTAEQTGTAAAMPESATFIAHMPGHDGKPPMVMAVTVDGDRVVAYACNGANDAAWFFGTQKDGAMDLTNPYLDNLKATFDGTKLNGTLMMNEPDAKPQTFAASSAAEPAGMYTATRGDARASWVVMPDGRMVGIMQPNSNNDREVINQIDKQPADFKEKVREARLNRAMEPAPQMAFGSWTMDMNGTTVKAVRVTGNITSLPNTN